MSVIQLYIDEDSQDQALLRALRARRVDVITVKDTQTEGLIDIEWSGGNFCHSRRVSQCTTDQFSRLMGT